MLSPVLPSVCHTSGSVKIAEVRIMQFSLYSSPSVKFVRDRLPPKIMTIMMILPSVPLLGGLQAK